MTILLESLQWPALIAFALIFVLLNWKPIIRTLQILICRLLFQWSVERCKIMKRYTWTKEELLNSTTSVVALYTYHIKSIPAVFCNQVVIDQCGISGDRRFMLVMPRPVPLCGYFGPNDATHRFITQNHYPILSHIVSSEVQSEVTPNEKFLRLSNSIFPNKTITIAQTPKSAAPVYRSTLWNDIVSVQDMGDEAASYFQSILSMDTNTSETLCASKSVRLVVQHKMDNRIANERYLPTMLRSIIGCNPRMHLGSDYPVLIASEASLDDLNRRLNGKSIESIPITRFRPNIVIKGITPFAEDRMKVVQIGTAIFHIVSCCPRCKQICIDDSSGNRTSEPLNTMMEFRVRGSDNVYFAVHAIPDWNAIGKTIHVGDTVKVLQWGEPIWGDS